MNKQSSAEIHILDRLIHFLGEGSVQYLSRTDEDFNDYIRQLQESIWMKKSTLQNTRT